MRPVLLVVVVSSFAFAQRPSNVGQLLEQAGNEAQQKCELGAMQGKQMESLDAQRALKSARDAIEAGSPMRDELDAALTSSKSPGADFGSPLVASRLNRLRGRLFECVRDAELVVIRVHKAGAAKSADARKLAIAAAETFIVRYPDDPAAMVAKKWLAELKLP